MKHKTIVTIGITTWIIGMALCALSRGLKEDNSVIIQELENGFAVLENPNN